MEATWLWIRQNPYSAFAVVVYLVANVGPRPHPEHQSGYAKAFWSFIDRLCFLTASRLPGRFKMFLAVSPTSVVAPPATPGAQPNSVPEVAEDKDEKDKKESLGV